MSHKLPLLTYYYDKTGWTEREDEAPKLTERTALNYPSGALTPALGLPRGWLCGTVALGSDPQATATEGKVTGN